MKCAQCGLEVDFIRLKSGQRVPVDPVRILAAVGDGVGGKITSVRILHWVSCSGASDEVRRVR